MHSSFIPFKSMELCKLRFKTMGLEHMAKFYVVNAEKLSEVIPVEQYDLIWSFGVIHHRYEVH